MGTGVTSIFIVVLIAISFWMFILWKNSRKLDDDIRRVAQQHNLIRHDDRVRALCRAIHLVNPHVNAGVDYIIQHDNPAEEPTISEWRADVSRPSAEQINSALQELDNSYHEEEYAAMRRAEYPSVGEQLDAMYEARQGNNAKQLEVDEKIRRVKEKYPKAEECV
jgi:hypothetical protein